MMHKNIAKIIGQIIDESPYNDMSYKINSNNSAGFWEIEIFFKNSMRNAHTESLKTILPYIGRVYGEGLFVEEMTKKHIVVS